MDAAKKTLRIFRCIPTYEGNVREEPAGSCTVIDTRTLLTALHVVDNPDYSYKVQIGTRMLKLKIGPIVQGLDVVRLTVSEDIGIAPIEMDYAPLRVGDKHFISGFAWGEHEVQRHGIVEGFASRPVYRDDFFCYVESTAFVQGGMSGGCVIRNGKMVGVVIESWINREGSIFISAMAFQSVLDNTPLSLNGVS